MKKALFVLTMTASIFFIGSCNTASNSDPKVVLLSFFDAIGKKDIEGAKKLATAETKPFLDKMAQIFELAKSTKIEQPNNFDKANVEFGEAKIEGDKATIPVTEKTSGRVNDFLLKKEEGTWKVDLNIASMMQANQDKMSDLGSKGIDSLSKEMDKMKTLNVDSFSAAMKKGMHAADSMLKKLQEH